MTLYSDDTSLIESFYTLYSSGRTADVKTWLFSLKLEQLNENNLNVVFSKLYQKPDLFFDEIKTLSYHLSREIFFKHLNALMLYTPNVEKETPLRQWMALYDGHTFHPVLSEYLKDNEKLAYLFKQMLYGHHLEDARLFLEHQLVQQRLDNDDFFKQLLHYSIRYECVDIGQKVIAQSRSSFNFDYRRIAHPYPVDKFEILWQSIEAKKRFNALQTLPTHDKPYKVKKI